MAVEVIAGRARQGVGKGAARSARRAGFVPAVICGKGLETQSIEVNERALDRVLRAPDGRQATVSLEIEGAAAPTVVTFQAIQREPASRELLHVDFQVVASGSDGE